MNYYNWQLVIWWWLFFTILVPSQPKKLTMIPSSPTQNLKNNLSPEFSSQTFFTSPSLLNKLLPNSEQSLMSKSKILQEPFRGLFDKRRLILTWNQPEKPNSIINRYQIMFYKSDKTNRTQFMSTVSIDKSCCNLSR